MISRAYFLAVSSRVSKALLGVVQLQYRSQESQSCTRMRG
jgi:hypothetical protein